MMKETDPICLIILGSDNYLWQGEVEFQKALVLKIEMCPAHYVFAPLLICAQKSCPPQQPHILMCVKTYDLSFVKGTNRAVQSYFASS